MKDMNLDGISIIIPSFSDVKTNSNSVMSCMKQQLGKLDEKHPKVEVIIMNDDIDHPDKYDVYNSEEMKKFYDSENITIRVVDNKKYMTDEWKLYQGGSRIFGTIKEATYDYCIWLDDDDMLTPNAVRSYWDILQEESQKEGELPIACIGAIFRSFDSNHYQKDIGKDGFSIWVQGRLWSKQFCIEHNLTDETIYRNKINRRQGEDYLFVQMFDYCCEHEEDRWRRIMTKDFICGFWVPNYNSLSRRDPFYGQHLSGSTMSSSNRIYEFMMDYNNEHGFDCEEDEKMKHKILNMTIYSWFNLYDFIWTIGLSKRKEKQYKPLEEDWYLLRDNVKSLRDKLLIYWPEIQDNDVIYMLEAVMHRSDCRIHNLWEGTFFDYMNNGCRWFDYDYKTMMKEVGKLGFDALNCSKSPKVEAWKKRHAAHN